jgi:hypothetical protein
MRKLILLAAMSLLASQAYAGGPRNAGGGRASDRSASDPRHDNGFNSACRDGGDNAN